MLAAGRVPGARGEERFAFGQVRGQAGQFELAAVREARAVTFDRPCLQLGVNAAHFGEAFVRRRLARGCFWHGHAYAQSGRVTSIRKETDQSFLPAQGSTNRTSDFKHTSLRLVPIVSFGPEDSPENEQVRIAAKRRE